MRRDDRPGRAWRKVRPRSIADAPTPHIPPKTTDEALARELARWALTRLREAGRVPGWLVLEQSERPPTVADVRAHLGATLAYLRRADLPAVPPSLRPQVDPLIGSVLAGEGRPRLPHGRPGGAPAGPVDGAGRGGAGRVVAGRVAAPAGRRDGGAALNARRRTPGAPPPTIARLRAVRASLAAALA